MRGGKVEFEGAAKFEGAADGTVNTARADTAVIVRSVLALIALSDSMHTDVERGLFLRNVGCACEASMWIRENYDVFGGKLTFSGEGMKQKLLREIENISISQE